MNISRRFRSACLALFALTIGAVTADAGNVSYRSGYWYPAGGPAITVRSLTSLTSGKLPLDSCPGGLCKAHFIGLHPFVTSPGSSFNIDSLAARIDGDYPGETFEIAIYDANLTTAMPQGFPVVRCNNYTIDAGLPTNSLGEVLTCPVFGSPKTLLADHLYYAAVASTDSATIGFENYSVTDNTSAYFIGSTDEHDLTGQGSIGGFSFVGDNSSSTYPTWPNIGLVTLSKIGLHQSNAYMLFKIN